MGTEVLRPQDCLIQNIRVAPAVFHNRKNYGNSRSNTTTHNHNNYRKPRRSKSPENNNLVVGVRILKRGEFIDSKVNITNKKPSDIVVYGTGRLGPDPEMVPKQMRLSPKVSSGRVDTYAGSAFSLSPSPRALPLPSFFSKKQGSEIVDDSATRDLRRLLRLDWKKYAFQWIHLYFQVLLSFRTFLTYGRRVWVWKTMGDYVWLYGI